MKICAIIPSHNHSAVIADVIAKVGLPVFVIDDGSSEPTKSVIANLKGVTVHRLDINQGKGGAVMEGFRLAYAAGFTHAVQIDADGQHDLSVLPQMLKLAEENPDALISGQPIYDESIPTARKIGRWFTHVWVWVETLSLRITDSMCGFRIYPLEPVMQLAAKEKIGKRMDFDTDIMVRLFWRGVNVIMVPVKVTYPVGNTSNFDVLRDNWRITKMHTKLVFTMLLRLPSVLKNRPRNNAKHWSRLGEVGAYWGLKFCALTYRIIGRTGCRIIMSPIVFYFYASGRKRRQASLDYLTKALGRPAKFWDGYKHYMNFGLRILDSFVVWTGDIPVSAMRITDKKIMDDMAQDKRGGLIIVAHIGNVEVARALHDKEIRERMVMMSHTKNAENYNRIMREFHPEAVMDIIQVTEIGPETIIKIKDRVEGGAWASIAGDRTPVTGKEYNTTVPFLGSPAQFAQGPWIMASLLDCPVYLLFCMPNGKFYDMTMEKFADKVTLPRRAREEGLKDYISRYAARLEEYVKKYPYQWFNFYDFWQE